MRRTKGAPMPVAKIKVTPEMSELLLARARHLRADAEGIERGELVPWPRHESWEWWRGFACALRREAMSLEGAIELHRIGQEAEALAEEAR